MRRSSALLSALCLDTLTIQILALQIAKADAIQLSAIACAASQAAADAVALMPALYLDTLTIQILELQIATRFLIVPCRRLLLIGFGVIHSENTVRAVSREGDRWAHDTAINPMCCAAVCA